MSNHLKQVSKNKKHKVDPSIEPIFPDFDKETSKQESKKKSKDRKAGFLVDSRKIYPPFKRDRDNFFLCDYINPQTGKPCNLFFGAEKSINAHYSRVHNKDNNPNRLRRLDKEGMNIEKHNSVSHFISIFKPKQKQTKLSDYH